jgi:hypothetical protein
MGQKQKTLGSQEGEKMEIPSENAVKRIERTNTLLMIVVIIEVIILILLL